MFNQQWNSKITSCTFGCSRKSSPSHPVFSSHHKRAAAELQPLVANATHGILAAEEYIPAKLNSLFSANAYGAFDIGQNVGKVRPKRFECTLLDFSFLAI